eukprot:scaffold37125_cov62-Phaeocystis_antarctica.AAC.7
MKHPRLLYGLRTLAIRTLIPLILLSARPCMCQAHPAVRQPSLKETLRLRGCPRAGLLEALEHAVQPLVTSPLVSRPRLLERLRPQTVGSLVPLVSLAIRP